MRGVASRVEVDRGYVEIGRFGWRAQAPRLQDFVRGACGGELGLTVPDGLRGFGQIEDADRVPDPELIWQEVDELSFYCRELAPPPRGGRAGEPEVRRGEALFTTVGCAVCHVPSLHGSDGPVPLYSDLLLHVVVEDAGSGGSGDDAGPVGIRTPPLWGIGKTAPYLHDGRAEDLTAAIEGHGGEALRARAAWQALNEADREALLAFLMDL